MTNEQIAELRALVEKALSYTIKPSAARQVAMSRVGEKVAANFPTILSRLEATQVMQEALDQFRFDSDEDVFRLIDKINAALAALSETHLIETQTEPLPAGDDGELCGQLKALARCEHSDLSVAEEAAARIAALNAEVARQDEALAQISDLARQLGEAQGKLEASGLPGIADGWRGSASGLRQKWRG